MNPRQRTDAAPETPATAWWRVGVVWLVVGGPLAVVIASLVTVAIAMSGAEEVLTTPAYDPASAGAATLPALQGRNHAASPKR